MKRVVWTVGVVLAAVCALGVACALAACGAGVGAGAPDASDGVTDSAEGGEGAAGVEGGEGVGGVAASDVLDASEPEPGADGAGAGVVCPGDDIDLTSREIPSVSVEEAGEMVAANPRLVVLDVRTPVEFAGGHLAGAVNIDFQSGTFETDVAALDADGEYLVYCRSGVRSAKAVATMQDLGFVRVTNMLGGYTEWTFQKRPTEQ